MKKLNRQGFSMIEMIVVIGIIGLLAAFTFNYLGGARGQAGDAKRFNDINQLGKLLAFGCPVPDAGVGEYDLSELVTELKAKYPQHAKNIPSDLYDPKTGNATETNYKYIVNADGNCVLYANLEEGNEEATLQGISEPAPGGGKGIFESAVPGWNGSTKYFQVSN